MDNYYIILRGLSDALIKSNDSVIYKGEKSNYLILPVKNGIDKKYILKYNNVFKTNNELINNMFDKEKMYHKENMTNQQKLMYNIIKSKLENEQLSTRII